MRILHVFDHSLPLQSGYVSRSLSIIRSQQARGWHTFHVTTPRYLPSDQTFEMIDGVKYYRSRRVGVSTAGIRELLEMESTRRTLEEIIRLEHPDIIHAHSPVLTALPTLAASRKFNLPVVYEVRALWEDAAVDYGSTSEGTLRYKASRLIETSVMRRADRVVTLCESLRKEIAARGIPADRIAVVPNGVDADFLNSLEDGQEAARESLGLTGRFVLGFIGSFYTYEGLDLLLAAASRLSEALPNLVILLVGGGPDEHRLRGLVQKKGIDPLVRFTGRVHHSQISRYYAAADVMVFPRTRSRLTDLVTPLKPLEAMAREKPVIASDVGGHRELIEDCETGYLFSAGDLNALTGRILEVARNPKDRSRVAHNGRVFVARERIWDRVADRYAELYGQLLGQENPEGSRRFAA
jgi:glycogen synthase